MNATIPTGNSGCRGLTTSLPIALLSFCLFLLASSGNSQSFAQITGHPFAHYGKRAAWIDYDRDGYMDLFLTREYGNAYNELYKNNGNGTFTAVESRPLVLTYQGTWCGQAWGDYDNDGWDDVFVCDEEPGLHQLYRNVQGAFTFVDIALVNVDGDNSKEANWVDVNNDGWLDLFVANGYSIRTNYLYLNNGGTSFAQVTSWLIVTNAGKWETSAWADFNGDGYPDVALGGYWQNLAVYTNMSGTNFAQASLSVAPRATDVTWGDYDNDGDLDLFSCSFNNGNMLYRNDGNGVLTPLTSALVSVSAPSYACSWADVDNDGDLDLFVVNNQDTHFLYLNDGAGSFTQMAFTDVPCLHAAWGDYDNDGCLDLVLAGSDQAHLFHNNGGTNKWLKVRCVGKVSNKSGIGVKVRAKAMIRGSPIWQIREIGSGTGAGGSDGLVAHFGLAGATNVEVLQIEWPSGEVQTLMNLPANSFQIITETGFPRIISQPQSQAVYAGTNVTFTVVAAGPAPLSFQWLRSGTNMSGQTSATLALNNVQPPDVGTYSVIVSNPYGSVTSSNATLVVNDNDSDRDTMPDFWETQYGLNPFDASDAYQDKDGDGVLNLFEYRLGTRPDLPDTDGDGLTDYQELFVYGTNPTRRDTDGDGIEDNVEIANGTDPNVASARYYYDKTDRLVGAEYDKGLFIQYVYDGNGNLLRQRYSKPNQTANRIPVIWKLLSGLSVTNNAPGAGAFDDPDGDGWSNYQEWKAGSNPSDPNNRPDVFGLPGINLGSFQWPFTPTNFVVATGQLDGNGADEIVIGADGDATGKTNFVVILSQAATGWTSTNVLVGEFGVTSLAIGQPTNREVPAIYAGLRSATSTGGVMEVRQFGGTWQTNMIAHSTNASAQVLGVRSGRDVQVSLAAANAPGDALYGMDYTTVWRVQLFDTTPSHRGLGTLAELISANQEIIRLLDQAGIQVLINPAEPGSVLALPAVKAQPPGSSSWYFLTETAMGWFNAQAYARSYGGNLVTINDVTENAWVIGQFGSSAFWIGLYRDPGPTPVGWKWISGTPYDYSNWVTPQPNNSDGNAYFVRMEPSWNDVAENQDGTYGLVEVVPGSFLDAVLIPEPAATRRKNWPGKNLDAGFLRQDVTNAHSIFYAFIDDKNENDKADTGDDFVLAEFLLQNASGLNKTLFRQPVLSGATNPAYGLAVLNFTNGAGEVFFTGEPDGRVFYWIATNATGPLQRQLFSSHHSGKTWHALAGVKTLEPGEGLVGLRVDPAAPNTCDVIFWPPQSELWKPADVPQTAPLAAIVTPPASGNGIALVNVQ